MADPAVAEEETTDGAGIDWAAFLEGDWKRLLEWRSFGGTFAHVRTSNTVVRIEPHRKVLSRGGGGGGSVNGGSGNGDGGGPGGERYLRWSFGKAFTDDDLAFGYVMKFTPVRRSDDVFVEWDYCGTRCHGKFMAATQTAVLNFFLPTSTVVVTYRIVDTETMAVSVVEVSDRSEPTLQYGTMIRVDSSLYDT